MPTFQLLKQEEAGVSPAHCSHGALCWNTHTQGAGGCRAQSSSLRILFSSGQRHQTVTSRCWRDINVALFGRKVFQSYPHVLLITSEKDDPSGKQAESTLVKPDRRMPVCMPSPILKMHRLQGSPQEHDLLFFVMTKPTKCGIRNASSQKYQN